ncbi:MAG: 2-oxo acid dehydrogenase subunit E2, partial [Chloroflexi bacterium]|nr:2-oxo acid dehydrogenase subunit E2 [Chloroflexota bacterium]
MSVEIKVPQLGESVVEATIGRWLKQEGDHVSPGDSLVELETDKVNVEVPSSADGTLQSIVKPEGETVTVGDVIALVAEGQAPAQSDGQPGDTPEGREGAAPEPPAPPSPVGAGSAVPAPPAGAPREAPSPSQPGDGDGVRATPLARRIAAEHGLDLGRVEGSGPGGRVRREDVAAYLEQQVERQERAPSQPAAPPAPAPSPQPAAAPAADVETAGGRREERVRMSRRRRTIAQRLVEAQHTAAMLTTFNEADMTAIMDVRKRRRDAFKERHGVGLGFMSFFTRAVVGALKAFPRLNAEIQGDE